MTPWDMPQHTYEEVRDVIMDVLLGRADAGEMPNSFEKLVTKVTFVFGRRSVPPGRAFNPADPPRIHPYDAEFVRDVFWDLFRQGFITLGIDSSHNAGWPWFRLSRFGAEALQNQSPYRFHDTASYLAIVKKEIPDISAEALAYLDEAVAALYADCLLASCVMLGVAAEAEFLRLLDVATASAAHGTTFAPVLREKFIRSKITKFHTALNPLLPTLQPRKDFEDLDTNLTLIQSVLRITRNDAGHPTAVPTPTREQVYVYLQMFIPFARQVMKLRSVLS
jgi:hypothetical protein